MKLSVYSILLICCTFLLSCDNDDIPVEQYEVAVPVTMSIADFRASVSLEEPVTIEESGKIYVYEDYIFVNDKMKGILVINNTNNNPKVVKYIKIPQNTDIAVKGDVLFANSGRDLVTFNISNINDIKIMGRLNDVLEEYYPEMPEGVWYTDFSGYDSSQEVVMGYTIEKREREKDILTDGFINFAESGDSGANSGTGGSMARFNIGGDHLYTVGNSSLHVFDISNLNNPQKINSNHVGWQIETIFNKEGYLYLGSAVGMYIYSLEDPSVPAFMSQIQHVMGCDPVVVTNDIAYVTIRGGNMCGQNENQLEVIDVSDKANPQLLKIYEMQSPYGLGVWSDKLFVCEGSAGLKVYDATNSPELVLTDYFEDIEAYDVIPLKNVLLLIGGNVLRQYNYENNKINLISTLDLN